jgi:hypothetical protein
MINQLLLYDISPALENRFLERFRLHAQRIMTGRYGFRIKAMWIAREEKRVRFVYLLWKDMTEMQVQWKAFMADAEWERIKQESRVGSSEPVLAIEDLLLQAVDFSAPL